MSDNDNLNNSAPALGAGGPRFESWYPDKKELQYVAPFLFKTLIVSLNHELFIIGKGHLLN